MDGPKYTPHFDKTVQGVVIGDNNTVTINLPNGEKQTVPFLAPLVTEELVGRDALLHDLKQRMFHGRCDCITVLIQSPGIGKTALAAKLAWDEEVIKHFCDGVLWAGLGPDPDVFALLGKWAAALGISSSELVNLSLIQDRAIAIRQKIGLRRMLLVIDDAWQSSKALVFRLGGPNCIHLVTTRLIDVAGDCDCEGTTTVHELGEDDGLALLKKVAPKAVKAEPEEARELVRKVGANPLALTLMGKYLWKESYSDQPRRIRDALERLQTAQERLKLELPQSPIEHHPGLAPETPLSLMASIHLSEQALDEKSQHTLRALSVFRAKPSAFSADAATAVTGASAETLNKLVAVGLLETNRDDYLLPRTIADYAIAKAAPEDTHDLHCKAIAYYEGWLRKYEEEKRHATSYERMYSYEDPEWQDAKSAWTYHIRTSTSDRTVTHLYYARLYFDAFWWWGCYRAYPFCDKILSEWSEAATTPEYQEWLNPVLKFQGAYPLGYEKRGKGDWQAVDAALLSFRERAGFNRDISQIGDPSRHIRAITDIFLAESWRYRSVNDPKTDAYYLEALDLFKGANTDDDAWSVPWTLWHLGDLYMERSQGEKALNICQESMELAMAATPNQCEWDNEVISNNLRVQADVFWQKHDFNRAFCYYARAVFYAYVFHGCPHPPDFYTLDFYSEMINRTLDRIRELWHGNQTIEALSACSYLQDFWKPYWESVGREPVSLSLETLLSEDKRENLAEYLFPPQPTNEEIEHQAPEYVSQISKMLDLFADRIKSDI